MRDTIAATLAGFFRLRVVSTPAARLGRRGVIFLVGGGALIFLAVTGRWRAALPATAVMMVGILAVAACGLKALENYFSLKQVALAANRLAGPAGEVVVRGLAGG